jgi:hypothetical protein
MLDRQLPHRQLLVELWHHHEALRRRLTRASCSWP